MSSNSTRATRARRQERLDRGTCGECGVRPPKLDRYGLRTRVCEECAAARLQYYKEWRARAKERKDVTFSISAGRCKCGLLLPCIDCPLAMGVLGYMVGAAGNLSGG